MRQRNKVARAVRFLEEGGDSCSDSSSREREGSESLVDSNGYVEFRRIIKSTPSTRHLKKTDRAPVPSVSTSSLRDDESTKREDEEGTNRVQEETPSFFSLPFGERHDVRVYCVSFGEDATGVMRTETTPSIPILMSTTDVLIAVEASTVSPLDCTMRRGMLKNYGFYPPYVTGCDFVGTVIKCGDEAFLHGISEGDRVASILRWGGNARYVIVPAAELVHVPREIPPNDAVCTVLTYFIAFQAIHSGMHSLPKRYSTLALTGKRILVVGQMSLVGRAIVELSHLCGAHTYITCPKAHHERIKSLGATPLEYEATSVWLPKVKGRMDLVIEVDGANKNKEAKAALKKSGRLVRIGTPTAAVEYKASCCPVALEDIYVQTVLSFTPRAAYYDVFYSIENNPDLFKNDMSHLFNLLVSRKIKPYIERHVLLQEVPDAHSEVQNDNPYGAIVCEPWRRGRGGFGHTDSW